MLDLNAPETMAEALPDRERVAEAKAKLEEAGVKYILSCWIDLLVPFCGDYLEATLWSENEQALYHKRLAKRAEMAEIAFAKGDRAAALACMRKAVAGRWPVNLQGWVRAMGRLKEMEGGA